MLKKLLNNKGIELTEELSNSVVTNIKNRIKQNRKTSLHELLQIAEKCV